MKKEDLCATLEHEQDRYKAEAVQALLALNQTFKKIAPKQHLKLNPILKRAANLGCQISDPSLPPSNQTFFKPTLKKISATYDV
jgi:hypothetical protein